MSIASEITRINGNIVAAYTALDGKGATLPETQNSANLADTIASVSTGGGGSGYDSFKSMVYGIQGAKTYKQLVDDGWIVKTSSKTSTSNAFSAAYILGFVFDENMPVFYLRSKSAAFRVPEDAIVTEYTTDVGNASVPSWKIDMTNCSTKWLIVYENIVSTGLAGENIPIFSYNDLSSGSSLGTYTWFSYVKYYCISTSDTSYSENSPNIIELSKGSSRQDFFSIGSIAEFSHILEDVEICPRIKLSLNDDLKDLFYIPKMFIPVSKIFDIEKFVTNCFSNVTYGVTAFTGQKTNSAMYYYASYLGRCKKFPFVLDGSGITANSNTWYLGSVKKNGTDYSNDYPMMTVPEELFIIAPDMNINWQSSDAYGNRYGNHITPRALKFFADNSPNVTNKKLTIGSANICIANEADPTIITTLTSKGWTVQ